MTVKPPRSVATRSRRDSSGFDGPNVQPWSSTDARLAALIALVAILLRLPYRSQTLNTWDSVLFALGMDHYSVPEARPHPPGYPVYVFVGWLLKPFFHDANATLVAVSLVFTALAIFMLYRVARNVACRRVAIAAASLFALSPVLLYNSVIATTYAGEAFFSLLVAHTAWTARHKQTLRSLLALAISFGLALGFRASLLFFLSPLVVWAFAGVLRDAWPKRSGKASRNAASSASSSASSSLLAPSSSTITLASSLGPAVRRVLVACIAGLATGLVWFVPMVVMSGGLKPYLAATRVQSGLVVFAESVFKLGYSAWIDHWTRFRLYLNAEEHILMPMAAVLIIAGPFVHRSVARWRVSLQPVARAPTWFLVWLIPATAFYLLIFDGWDIGPDGYILSILPGVYLLFAWLLESVLAPLGTAWRERGGRSSTTTEVGARGKRNAGGRPRRDGSSPGNPGSHTSDRDGQRRDSRTVWNQAFILVTVALILIPGTALAMRWPATYQKQVAEHDDWVNHWLRLSESFPPSNTSIVTSYSWAHVKWYYPEYTVWSYLHIPTDPVGPWDLTLETKQHKDDIPFYTAHALGPNGRTHAVAATTQRIVLFDFQLAGENGRARQIRSDIPIHEAHLADGWRILYIDVDAAHPTIESYFTHPGNAPYGASA